MTVLSVYVVPTEIVVAAVNVKVAGAPATLGSGTTMLNGKVVEPEMVVIVCLTTSIVLGLGLATGFGYIILMCCYGVP